MTERQDFHTRELAHAILQNLIGLGQSDMLEAYVINGQDLIAHVDGSASVRNARLLHTLHQDLILATARRLAHIKLNAYARAGRLLDLDEQRAVGVLDRVDNGRVVFDQEQGEALALLYDVVSILERGVEQVYAVYGYDSIADLQSALAVRRSARSYVRHDQRPRLELVLAVAAANGEAVRIVLFLELYVNGLRAHRLMRMNSYVKRTKLIYLSLSLKKKGTFSLSHI